MAFKKTLLENCFDLMAILLFANYFFQQVFVPDQMKTLATMNGFIVVV